MNVYSYRTAPPTHGSCLSVQGVQKSNVEKLAGGCAGEMLKGNQVVLQCKGYASFYPTLAALRRVNRQLASYGRQLYFCTLARKEQIQGTGKMIAYFEFHLHERPMDVDFRLRM